MAKVKDAYMKKYGLLIILALSVSLQAIAAPQTNWYQVEVIVFKNLNPQGFNDEQWPDDPMPALPKNRIELNRYNPNTPVTAYEQLPRQDFTLKKERHALRLSKNFRPILHVAWLQPGDATTPVHIYGGDAYNNDGKVIDPDDSDITQATSFEFNGSIKIKLDRFFNVTSNMNYCIPNTSSDKEGNLQCFNSLQTRRMRSKELNYLDHPLFGLLIKITKAKAPGGTVNAN